MGIIRNANFTNEGFRLALEPVSHTFSVHCWHFKQIGRAFALLLSLLGRYNIQWRVCVYLCVCVCVLRVFAAPMDVPYHELESYSLGFSHSTLLAGMNDVRGSEAFHRYHNVLSPSLSISFSLCHPSTTR